MLKLQGIQDFVKDVECRGGSWEFSHICSEYFWNAPGQDEADQPSWPSCSACVHCRQREGPLSSVSITVWSFITLLKWDSGNCSSLPPAPAVGLTLSNHTIPWLSKICCLPRIWHHTPGRPVRSLLFIFWIWLLSLSGEGEGTRLLVSSNLCLYFLPFHIDHLQSPFAVWFIHLAQCPFFPMLSLPRLPWPSFHHLLLYFLKLKGTSLKVMSLWSFSYSQCG